MQERNPYEPPQAQILVGSSHSKAVETQPELQYAGFWRRFGAYWIDALIFLPFTGVAFLISERSRLVYVYWFVPALLLGLFFHIYLVKRFGGTPGKLVLKTRISLLDGSAITLKAAVLRHSVLFLLTALSNAAVTMGVLAMTDEQYFSVGYLERSQKIVEMAPPWQFTVSVLLQVWIWGEFVTMLFNKRRRAVHDFIAGTVVVRSMPST